MKSWEKHLPDYEIKEWNESNSPLDNKYCRDAYDKKLWSKVSNYVRLWAVHNEGGIYLDTDFEILKRLDPLLSNDCFLGFQRVEEVPGWLTNGIFGAVAGTPFLKKCMEKTELIYGTEGYFILSPRVTTLVLREMGLDKYGFQKIDEVTLYPVEYFYPYTWLQEFTTGCVTDNTYAMHHWNFSWNPEKILNRKLKKEKGHSHDPQFKHPGSWLFRRRVLSWLENPDLKSQLPFCHRLFASFANMYFKHTGNDDWKAGRRIFLIMKFISSLIGLKSFANLSIGDDLVCLDLTDPRFFKVVHELQNKSQGIQNLVNLLYPGDTFIDVGANHGSFSLVASRLVGLDGLIIAIEPQARKARAVESTLQMNGHSPFQVHRVVLGNTNSEAKLLIPIDTSGSAGVFKQFSGTDAHMVEKVQVKRFDDLFGSFKMPGRVVMKIDIEGSEYVFLDGAKKSIRMLHPVILLEINPKSLRAAGVDGENLIKMLEKLGYRSYSHVQSEDEQHGISKLRTDMFQNIILR